MIAILSDFNDSEYLGVMKGVIFSVYKDAKIVDLCNKIKQHNIKEGAWVLLQSYKYFPKNTVFLCVVDPGVGSERQAIAVKTKYYYFVGPDNGLMWPAIKEDGVENIVKLSTENASFTFHGRDVFARVAAKLEKGIKIESIGIKTGIKNKLEFYLNGRKGEIARVDDFGNIITNLKLLNKNQYDVIIKNKELKMNFYKTYSEAKEHELFLVEGSSKTLEISVKNGRAVDKLKVNVGERIIIK